MGEDQYRWAYSDGKSAGMGELLNAAISKFLELKQLTPTPERDSWVTGQWLLLVHMVMVARGLPEEEAAEWLAETLQDRVIAMAD